MRYGIRAAILFAMALAAAPASAQVAGITRTIQMTFTGVVTNDVTNSIQIRQPDGSFTPYIGPVPDYPYKQGDPVTISFAAIAPTQAYFATGGPYGGQVAADGIYRFGLRGPNNPLAGAANAGNTTGLDVSGPIGTVLNASQLYGMSGMTLVYDSNADSYSIEFAPTGFRASTLDGPGYAYNPATGALTATSTTCGGQAATGCTTFGTGGFALTGNGTSLGAYNIPIYDPTPSGASGPSAFFSGLFELLFAGNWNLPVYGTGSSSGGATDVPEPGMMLLFGGGAAFLARRRRTAAKAWRLIRPRSRCSN